MRGEETTKCHGRTKKRKKRQASFRTTDAIHTTRGGKGAVGRLHARKSAISVLLLTSLFLLASLCGAQAQGVYPRWRLLDRTTEQALGINASGQVLITTTTPTVLAQAGSVSSAYPRLRLLDGTTEQSASIDSSGRLAVLCTGCGLTGSSLAQFAATTSAELAGVLSDETGTGLAVFNDTPTIITPAITTSATLTSAAAASYTAKSTLTSSTAQFQVQGDVAGAHTGSIQYNNSATANSNYTNIPETFLLRAGVSSAGMVLLSPAVTGYIQFVTGGSVTTTNLHMTIDSAGAVTLPHLASSSAATTGTMCWTTGTGNVNVDTTTTCLLSTKRIKKHIVSLDESLPKVLSLRPVAYHLKKDPHHLGQQVGLVAEEVYNVDRRLVSLDNTNAPLGVRYQQLTAVLVKAIQEQQDQISMLKARIDRLEQR